MEDKVLVDRKVLNMILMECESLKEVVQSVDHILGSDELYDLNYFISSIENLVESV